LQRLSEESLKDLPLSKRQSELCRNVKSVAEMSTPQKIQFIKNLHWEQNKSLREIAKIMGISYSGGLRWYITRYSIPTKSRIDSMVIAKGQKHLQERFSQGYKYVYKPNHQNRNQKGWIFEHRYVMSEKLGKPLKKDDVVHHIDGNKLNNDIENLELRKMGGRRKYHGVPVFCPHCKKKIF